MYHYWTSHSLREGCTITLPLYILSPGHCWLHIWYYPPSCKNDKSDFELLTITSLFEMTFDKTW